jgi:putative copper resistance protein D
MTGLVAGVRFLHLVAGTQLMGAFVFLLLVARPAFRSAGGSLDAARDALDRRILRLAAWALAGFVATGLAALALQTATVTGKDLAAVAPADLAGLLSGTRYGRVWLVRMAALAILAGFLLFRETERTDADWWAMRLEGALLAGVGLAALAWAGHAAAVEEWEAGALLADAGHLLATGAWLGGLAPLALTLGWARTAGDAGALDLGRAVTRRFSALALGTVLALVVTGLVNAWVHVREVPALVGTPYGHLLLAKVLCFLPLLSVAALNLLRLKPRVVGARSAEAARHGLGRLQQSLLLEGAMGVLILLIVGGLGVTAPARHTAPTWPFAFRLDWDATKDLPGVRARVAVGSQVATFGLIASLLAGITRLRRRGWVVAAGLAAIGAGLSVALPPLAIDAYPTTYARPAVPYTAISIARGLAHYRTHCVSCHGPGGYGDGPAAAGLPRRPADLTAKHAADHTVGDLFWWLGRGFPQSGMPGFADRLGDEDRWDIVNFLRTLAAADEARALGSVVSVTPSTVAPDFTYTTGIGDPRSLKELRGQRVVLLALFRLPDSLPRLHELAQAAAALARVGTQVLAVPLDAQPDIYRALAGRAASVSVAVDGAAEAATTYALFDRDRGPDGSPRAAAEAGHMEFLIDRQGYLRARFLLRDGGGWSDPARLLAEAEALARETPRAPPPDDHVH